MNLQERYPASQVNPGWQILVGNQWLVVDIATETEKPDGTHYITFEFEDPTLPAVKVLKTEAIPAKPPHKWPVEPES